MHRSFDVSFGGMSSIDSFLDFEIAAFLISKDLFSLQDEISSCLLDDIIVDS
jgi:hypothetical protein